MNISPVSNLNFNGNVYINKIDTAKEIAKIAKYFPESSDIESFKNDEQVKSFIGNINTLKHRLETKTPDDNRYEIIFNMGSDDFDEYIYSAYVTVYDRNNDRSTMSYVDLAQRLSSTKINFNNRSNGQRIWENAFEPVTDSALKDAKRAQKQILPPLDDSSYQKREIRELNDKERYVFDMLA